MLRVARGAKESLLHESPTFSCGFYISSYTWLPYKLLLSYMLLFKNRKRKEIRKQPMQTKPRKQQVQCLLFVLSLYVNHCHNGSMNIEVQASEEFLLTCNCLEKMVNLDIDIETIYLKNHTTYELILNASTRHSSPTLWDEVQKAKLKGHGGETVFTVCSFRHNIHIKNNFLVNTYIEMWAAWIVKRWIGI